MEYNDYELLYLAQDKNEEAIEILNNKYSPLINSRCNHYYQKSDKKGFDFNDLYQEALIGFNEAINSYNQDNNALFYTFALTVIDNKIVSFLKKNNTVKDKLYNEALSYDELEDTILNETISYDSNPLNKTMNEEAVLEFYNELKSVLTDKEMKILNMKIGGLSNIEIMESLGIDSKAIYNAMHRIKQKAKSFMEKGE